MIDNQIILDFQKKILDRYKDHARDLPWRKTTNPYKIWISESMLCQTQVGRVIAYYEKWMDLFPTVESLAKASNEEVLRAWSGLGYNSRALRLKQAAMRVGSYYTNQNSEVVNRGRRDVSTTRPQTKIDSRPNGGSDKNSDYFLNTYEELIKLPGVGDYIANAILAFAYNQDVVVIDTNIRRIMIHEFGNAELFDERQVKKFAQLTLAKGQARTWYNALMDYGALELTSKKTGIKPLTKQSKFQGSSRQVRAGIVKVILDSEGSILNYSDIQKLYPEREDLDQIISKMQKDGLIVVNGQTIFIKV